METIGLAILAVGLYASGTYGQRHFPEREYTAEAVVSFIAAIACLISAFI